MKNYHLQVSAVAKSGCFPSRPERCRLPMLGYGEPGLHRVAESAEATLVWLPRADLRGQQRDVVLDRRKGERRRSLVLLPPRVERRHAERRRCDIDHALCSAG